MKNFIIAGFFIATLALVILVFALGSVSVNRIPVSTKTKMKKRKIIQSYFADKQRVEKHTTQGLGDYLRGCIYLYNWCKANDCEFAIDFSRHKLASHLVCHTFSSPTLDNTFHCFDYDQLSKHLSEKVQAEGTVHVFTNGPLDSSKLTQDTKEFMKKHALTPKESMQKLITRAKVEMGLDTRPYVIVHARLGDAYVIDTKNSKDIRLDIMQKLVAHISSESQKHSILVLSDSTLFSKKMSELKIPNVFTTVNYGTPAHVGHHSGTIEQTQCTMLDFFLMSESSRIDQFSIYHEWSSGFSDYCSRIFDVPLHVYKL